MQIYVRISLADNNFYTFWARKLKLCMTHLHQDLLMCGTVAPGSCPRVMSTVHGNPRPTPSPAQGQIGQGPWCYIPRFSLKAFLVLERRICKTVVPYMGMTTILFSGAEPFKQIVHTLWTESPMWSLANFAQAVAENTFQSLMSAVVANLDFQPAQS